ncbi:hypothetical protein D9M68_525370 [compost metagenome]
MMGAMVVRLFARAIATIFVAGYYRCEQRLRNLDHADPRHWTGRGASGLVR